MAIAFTDANMYATSMAQRNVLKVTVPDRRIWLQPVSSACPCHQPARVISLPVSSACLCHLPACVICLPVLSACLCHRCCALEQGT